MQRRVFLSVVLFMLLGINLFAQKKNPMDSTTAEVHGKTFYTQLENKMDASLDFENEVDSGLEGMQVVDPVYLHNLGVIGTPAFPLTWELNQSPGFHTGLHQWDFYRYTPGNILYYNTQNPYTDLYYAQGPVAFQALKGVHTQNILPNWNFSIQFKKLGDQGFYLDQKSVHNNVAANTWYQSASRRYAALAGFIYNDFQFQESGGLKEAFYFQGDTFTNFQRLRAASYMEGPVQRWKETDFYIKQYLYLGKSREVKVHDTDSVAQKFIDPRFFLSHSFHVNRVSYSYTDEKIGGFFDTSYYDDFATHDSIWQRSFSNEISLGTPGWSKQDTGGAALKPAAFQARIFGSLDYNQFRQTAQDTIVWNGSVGAEFQEKGLLSAYGFGRYYTSGYNKGDYEGRLKIYMPLGKNLIFAEGHAQAFEPGYIYQKAYLNHFRWDNHFDKSSLEELRVGFTSAKGFSLTAKYGIYQKLVYLDSLIQPRQSDTGQHYLQLLAQGYFKLSKFHFLNTLTYQHLLQGSVIRIPALTVNTSWYYESYFFKKALLAEIGVDFGYNTAWYGYRYVPELSALAIQDTFKVGNYPVFDVWAAAKVKSLRFFIKMEHVNQGLNGYDYFVLPYYPLEPRTIRFGVRWSFYN